jgi:hypothetical protein
MPRPLGAREDADQGQKNTGPDAPVRPGHPSGITLVMRVHPAFAGVPSHPTQRQNGAKRSGETGKTAVWPRTAPDALIGRVRRATLAWLALGLAIALALVVRTGVRERGVITDHLEFGRRVLAGEELYAPFLDGDQPLHAPYPPGFGLLTAPFSLLPERVARFAWGLLQVGALVAIFAWLRGALVRGFPGLAPRAPLVLALTAVLGVRYVLRDTHGGGGNLINLALVLAAFTSAARGRAWTAGTLLGFSLATKPTAILMVPLLALFGQRRAAMIALAAAAAFTALALALLGQGLAPLQRWATGSYEYATMTDLFATPDLGFPPFSWMNQSLRCALVRFFGEVPPELAAQVPHFFQGLGLDASATAVLRTAVSVALLAITALALLPRHESGRDHAIAAVLALSLLLSPVAWKAHHVALLPAFALLLAHGFVGRRRAFVFAAAYLLACGPGEELVGKELKNTQQSLYLATAGTLALWAILLRGRVFSAARSSPADRRQ